MSDHYRLLPVMSEYTNKGKQQQSTSDVKCGQNAKAVAVAEAKTLRLRSRPGPRGRGQPRRYFWI